MDDPNKRPSDEQFREVARDHEGLCHVDVNAEVSLSDDGGAYVQAWVWVYDDQAFDAG